MELVHVVKDPTRANEVAELDAVEDAVQAEAAWARVETACAHHAGTEYHTHQAARATR
jgi:hypothetical protein